MKKWMIILCFLLSIPSLSVCAQDYTLQSGSPLSGTYAGPKEEDYNYYMLRANKKGYLAITAKTSNGKDLILDICDENREVIASDISVANKKTILHKCNKGEVYYIKIKGTEGVNYQISYKITTIDSLKYAKKYNYIVTNASLQENNMLEFPIKISNLGILHFMLETNHPLSVKYYNSKKKAISSSIIMDKKDLSGIGVSSKGKYYIRLYNPENTITGTTTICNIKYQMDALFPAKNTSRAKARALSKNKYVRTLIPAGRKTTAWFQLKITKKQKITITLDSQMMQNNGKNLQLYICDAKGKKLNSSPIIINGQASSSYKKKYIMKYPKTVFGTTAAFPEGTYYIKIESKTKTSSGAFQIKWN